MTSHYTHINRTMHLNVFLHPLIIRISQHVMEMESLDRWRRHWAVQILRRRLYSASVAWRPTKNIIQKWHNVTSTTVVKVGKHREKMHEEILVFKTCIECKLKIIQIAFKWQQLKISSFYNFTPKRPASFGFWWIIWRSFRILWMDEA